MVVSKSLKIIYVANARFPTGKAHGIQIAKMCEAFTALGAELELVVPERTRHDSSDIKTFYNLKHTFPVKKIWTLAVAPATSFGFRLSSFFFGLSSFLYIFKNRKRIDVLYSVDMDHISYFGIALAVFLLKKSGFVEMHAPKKDTFFYRMLFKNVRGVITINEIIKNDLKTSGIYHHCFIKWQS